MSNIVFFEIRAVYEVISKNVVEPDMSQMTIWRANTRTVICNTYCFSTRLNVTLNVHCLSCFFITISAFT